MELTNSDQDNSITTTGRQAAAKELGCANTDVQVVNMKGGYSRNHRSLAGYTPRNLKSAFSGLDFLS